MTAGRILIFFIASLVASLSPAAGPRPCVGNANCLSCHQRAVPVLPNRPCISCHAKNMEFLEESDRVYVSAPFWVMIGVAGAGVLALATLWILGFRRTGTLLTLAAGMAMASPGVGHGGAPPLPGAFLASRGTAADLSCVLSPSGDAALFQRRGPGTDPDGSVDLPGGQALFLWRRGEDNPLRVTGYLLDYSGAMAAWSPDGRRFAVPLPLLDTDSDGCLTRSDRAGLVLFDVRGNRIEALPAREHDLLNPCFSRDGTKLAFTEGAAIGVWDLATGGLTQALDDLGDGSFPRLFGWDPSDRPAFTRGYEYAVVGKSDDHRYILPEEIPLEAAEGGRSVVLTPPGPIPARRSRAAIAREGLAYLRQEKGGQRVLFVFDGASENRWTPEDIWVYGFEPSPAGGFWAWTAAGKGKPARLTRVRAPLEMATSGGEFRPNLLCLSGGTNPLACGPGVAEKGRLLVRRTDFDSAPAALVPGAFFSPSRAGDTSALVFVRDDTDGDGERGPLDLGELWISWSAP